MFNSTISSDSNTNKKRVPDWLNSTLWSSPSPTTPPTPSSSPQSTHDYTVADFEVKSSSATSAKPSAQKSEGSAYELLTNAPAHVHPSVVVRAEPAKVEIKDPLSGYYGCEDEKGNGHNGAAVRAADMVF